MGLSDRDWYREQPFEEEPEVRPRRHSAAVRLTALALLLVFVVLIALDLRSVF